MEILSKTNDIQVERNKKKFVQKMIFMLTNHCEKSLIFLLSSILIINTTIYRLETLPACRHRINKYRITSAYRRDAAFPMNNEWD